MVALNHLIEDRIRLTAALNVSFHTLGGFKGALILPIRNLNPFNNPIADIDISKNPYVLRLIEARDQNLLPLEFGPALEGFVGCWRQMIGMRVGRDIPKNQKLVVEIGCHYGHTLLELAQAFPDTLFLGIDITFKRVYMTAQKARALGLSNVFVILANAHGLASLFAPGEIDGMIVFFPDPWVKKKHAHNRLFAPKFCNVTWDVISDGGFLWLKTDQENYFSDACIYMKSQGFKPVDVVPIFGSQDFSSAFLRRFQLKGLPWYGQRWVKTSA